MIARGKSTRLLATIPDTYSNDWLSKIDKRTKPARAVRDRIAVLETDALAATKRSLNRHSVWLDLIIESHELRLAGGEQIDVGAYVQALNSLLGLFRTLGLDRNAWPVRRLRDVMESAA